MLGLQLLGPVFFLDPYAGENQPSFQDCTIQQKSLVLQKF